MGRRRGNGYGIRNKYGRREGEGGGKGHGEGRDGEARGRGKVGGVA